MLTRIGVLCCAIFLGSSAHAQVTFNTGYDLLPYCRSADDTLTGRGVPSGDTQQSVGEGFCMGIIAGIRYVVTSSLVNPQYKLCIPKNASNGQALGVVVNY